MWSRSSRDLEPVGFCCRAVSGLVIVGMMIGGHVLALEIAKLFEIIVNDEEGKNCLQNWWDIKLDNSWVDAIYPIAYVGMAFDGLVYLTILSGKDGLMFFVGIWWFLISFMANCVLTGGLCSTYIRNWWNNKNCQGDFIVDIYGLWIGSDMLLFVGWWLLAILYAYLYDANKNNNLRTQTLRLERDIRNIQRNARRIRGMTG